MSPQLRSYLERFSEAELTSRIGMELIALLQRLEQAKLRHALNEGTRE